MNEPKELHPFTLFRLPGLGQEHIKDFRPKPVPADVPLPPPPPAAKEVADPKSHSSATGSVEPSGDASSQTVTPEGTSSSSDQQVIPANVEKGSQSQEAASSLPKTLQLPGEAPPPAETTGPTPASGQLQIKTPSFQVAGSESAAP